MSRPFRNILAWTFIPSLLTAACSPSAGPSAPDAPDVKQTQQGLSYARMVTIEVYDPQNPEAPPTKQRVGVGSGHVPIWRACESEVEWMGESCAKQAAQPLCAARWAMTIAESVRPLYASATELSFEPDDIEVEDRRYLVQPPTPSDAAGWSELAAELYSESIFRLAGALNGSCVMEGGPNFPEGVSMTTSELLASELAEAIAGSMEATQARAKFIVNAAEAVTTAKDLRDATKQVWRSTADSRLAAIGGVAYVPRTAFENNGLVPMYKVEYPEGEFWSTADVGDLPLGANRAGEPLFSIYAPSLVDPFLGGTPTFQTYIRKKTLSAPAAYCTQSPADCLNSAYMREGGDIFADFPRSWRVEGWSTGRIFAEEGAELMWSLLYTGDVGEYEGTMPAFYLSQTQWDLHPVAYISNGLTDPSLEWPVILPEDLSTADQIAEALVRQKRLNPFLDGRALAEQLIDILSEERGSIASSALTATALLRDVGVTEDQLRRAAERVVLEAQVFGRGLTRDPNATTPGSYTVPQSGDRWVNDPVYLYARTEGAQLTDFDLYGIPPGSPSSPIESNGDDLLQGVRWFKRNYESLISDEDITPAAARMLGSAFAMVNENIGGYYDISWRASDDSAPNLISMKIVFREDDSEPSNDRTGTDLADEYDLWLGDAGLECALRQTIGGLRCVESQWKIADATAWSFDSNGRAVVELDGISDLSIQRGTRIYLTRTKPGTRLKALAGFAPLFPRNNATFTVRYNAFDPFMREILVTSLSPNRLNPAQGEVSCTGVSTTVKLEDELTPANENDSIDSSFRYYLEEARKAANVSDQLGEDLFAQGLQMDMRAEGAAKELEAICGGTINVGRLRDYACEVGDCDLAKLLSDATTEWPPELHSEVEGARDCFGTLGSTKPENVAVGNERLCAWRYQPDDNASEKYPPCVCPLDVETTCPPACPILLGEGESCATRWINYTDFQPVPIDRTLGVTVTGKDAPPTPRDLAVWLHVRSGLLVSSEYANLLKVAQLDEPTREALKTVYGPHLKFANAGQWATQTNFRNLAQGLGYKEDYEGDATITLGGDPWLDLDSLFAEYDSLVAAQVSPNDIEAQLPWPCGHLPEVRDLCEMDRAGSILCGRCAPAERKKLTSRLKEAVKSLKIMSGADWKNIFYRSPYHVTTQQEMHSDSEYLDAGEGPFPLDGSVNARYATVHKDGVDYRCYEGIADFNPGMLYCSTIQRSERPDSVPQDPSYLWSSAHCRGSNGIRNEEEGCGAIDDYIQNGEGISWKVSTKMNVPATTERSLCWRFTSTEGSISRRVTVSCGTEAFFSSSGFHEGDRSAEGCGVEPDCLVADLEFNGYKNSRAIAMSSVLEEGEITSGRMNDAFSLAYRIHALTSGGCDTLWSESPTVRSVRDFSEVSRAISCSADSVQLSLSRMFLVGVPSDLTDALRLGIASGTFPTHRGEYGETVAQLVATAQNLGRQKDSVVQAIRDAGLAFEEGALNLQALDLEIKSGDIDAYITELQSQNSEHAIDALELQAKISNLRLAQSISNSAASCIVATVNAIPKFGFPSIVETSPGSAAAAVATCANSGVQIGLDVAIEKHADRINGTQIAMERNNIAILAATEEKIRNGQQILEVEKRQVLLALQQAILEKADRINEALTSFNETYAQLHSLLSRLDSHRNKARRAAAEVLMLDNDDMGRVFNVNTAMRARMNTLRVRYMRAEAHAKRMAELARRSIEQKLGVELRTIDKPVGHLDAPRTWVDSLCSLPGFNYRRARDASARGEDQPEADRTVSGVGVWDSDGYNYANSYVGDYVSLLEQFVEAYRTQFPFDDGHDTMVVSLRDELLNIRETCRVAGPNELYGSDALSEGWQTDCSGAWCLTRTSSKESPFSCDAAGYSEVTDPADDDIQTCRPMGGAQGIELSYARRSTPVVGGGGGGGGETPVAPPGNGLSNWYRADHCPVTSSSPPMVASCENLGDNSLGENRTATVSLGAGASAHLNSSGINSLDTLELSAGSTLQTSTHGAASSSFTISFVYRAPTGADAQYAVWSQATANGTRTGQGRVSATGAGFYWQTATNSVLPAANEYSVTGEAPQGRPEVGSIVTVVSNDGSIDPNDAGAWIYSNGQLIGRSDVMTTSFQLGGILMRPLAGTATISLAEYLAYTKALTRAELSALHAYLGNRYGIDTLGPRVWFDGDDAERVALGGTSAESGVTPVGPNRIVDRGLGGPGVQYGTGAASSAPTGLSSFSAGHYGIDFGGDDLIRTTWPRYVCKRTNGYAAGCVESIYGRTSPTDHTTTIVAKVNDNLRHGLWTAEHRVETDLRVPSISVENGRVMVRTWTSPGVVSSEWSTGAGVVTIGEPFVVSLRSSTSSGTLDLFVNGKLELALEGQASHRGATRLGQTTWGTAAFLRGSVGEYMEYLRDIPDAELASMHQALATKYGIDLTDVSPPGGGTGGLPTADIERTQLRQTVPVSRGEYWLSWHEMTPCEAPSTLNVLLRMGDGEQEEVVASGPGSCTDSQRGWTGSSFLTDRWLSSGWSRRYTAITVPSGVTQLEVAIRPAELPVDTTDPNMQTRVFVGAPQLERIKKLESTAPVDFFPTGATLESVASICEDTDGDTFRGGGAWQYNCEYYCPFGTGSECESLTGVSSMPQRCFYELSFSVSQDDIEAGKLVQNAGFAVGNFNYRHDTLAVNLVGTAVKDCSGSSLPSTCYANSFLQYTLHHDGPFRVRNYDGNVYNAPLFPGRIQQAKALNAERYLTNPLASGDRGLLTDYWRNELLGRPIEGAYTLRLYDTPELDWSKLEDVQLLVNYRYWTRLQ